MKLTSRQQLLLEFVKTKHTDFSNTPEGAFKKYTGEPYWHHPVSVAERVAHLGLIEMALCHDLLEDTNCTAPELLKELLDLKYDTNIAIWILQGVVDLTDVYIKENFPILNRKVRKQKEAVRLGDASSWAQSVKYADLMDNTESITKHDPKFSVTYLREKKEMLEHMVSGNAKLRRQCIEQIEENKK